MSYIHCVVNITRASVVGILYSMKHLNEQTAEIARLIGEASTRKGVQWGRVTWLSLWLGVLLFCVLIPLLSFYIGMEYQKTVELSAVSSSV